MLAYTPIFFVGREKYTNFQRVLERPKKRVWFFHFVGEGGIGKTQLLLQLIKRLKEHEQERGTTILVTQEPLDFYLTIHQHESGLLKSIAEQLDDPDQPKFTAFHEAWKKAYDSPDDRLSTLRQHFLAGYQTLVADYIILLFDTTEVMSNAAKRFLKDMLPELRKRKPNTFIIAAGRKSLRDIPDNASLENQPTLPRKGGYEFHLEGFQAEEVKQFFKEQELPLKFTQAERLTELSRGKPILLSLVIDWMKFFGEPLESLLACKDDKFEQTIVERIGHLRFPEDQVILAMAHFHRRFNEQLIVLLFDKSIVEVRKLLKNLAQFSFVKFRHSLDGKPASCLLHDEMRELVNQYMWSFLDPLGTLRAEWDEKIIAHYTAQIEAEEDPLERENLEREYLFYVLRSDLNKGFAEWLRLFEENKNWEIKEAINLELKEFKEQLSLAQRQEVDFHRGLVLYDRGKYERAIEIFLSVQSDENCSAELWVKILPNLVLAYVNTRGASPAIQLAKARKDQFQKRLAESNVSQEIQRLNNAHFRYTIGYAYRKRGELNEAIMQYEKALSNLKGSSNESNQKLKALTHKNLAYVLHLLNRDREAKAHCSSALQITEKMVDFYEMGLARNVLGIIEADALHGEQAIYHFDRALEAFKKAKSERGKALVYTAYGRLLRQLVWLKVKKVKFADERAYQQAEETQNDYFKAMEMLDNAVDILRNTDKSNLAEALNEKGTLLREGDNYQEAIDCFKESLEVAEKFQDAHGIADNLQDLGIAYFRLGDFEQAEQYSKKAFRFADGQPLNYDFHINYTSDHIKGRAQRTLAECYFARGQYSQAFEQVVASTINIFKKTATGNLSERQEHFYDNWGMWISGKIKSLPSKKREEYASYVIENLGRGDLDRELWRGLKVIIENAVEF